MRDTFRSHNLRFMKSICARESTKALVEFHNRADPLLFV